MCFPNVVKLIYRSPHMIVWCVVEIIAIALFYIYNAGHGSIIDLIQGYKGNTHAIPVVLARATGHLCLFCVLITVALYPLKFMQSIQKGEIESTAKYKTVLSILTGIVSIFWTSVVWVSGIALSFMMFFILMICESVYAIIGILISAPFEILF